jgi:hypothetical protein
LTWIKNAPWSVKETGKRHRFPQRRFPQTTLLCKDEARRIAANAAKLPGATVVASAFGAAYRAILDLKM